MAPPPYHRYGDAVHRRLRRWICFFSPTTHFTEVADMIEPFTHLTVCLDMAGCPNRCRHCWLGHAPNGHLTDDDLRFVAGRSHQSAAIQRGRLHRISTQYILQAVNGVRRTMPSPADPVWIQCTCGVSRRKALFRILRI